MLQARLNQPQDRSLLVSHIGVGTGGAGPPQYFNLETLLIFIHAAQIATIVEYITFGPPKCNCFLRLCHTQGRNSLVPKPFLVGGIRKGIGRKGLVTQTPRIHGIDSCEATNAYKFITHTSNVKPHAHTTHSHETTHTYLTFAFPSSAVDPCYGQVIHQTLPSSLSHPHRKALGT